MQVIRCDICRCDSDGPADGWAQFSASLSDGTISPLTLDVCPECAGRIKSGLSSLLRLSAPDELESIDTVEERHILAVLTATDWNKSQAAKVLGIERCTLNRKLKKYRATRPVAK